MSLYFWAYGNQKPGLFTSSGSDIRCTAKGFPDTATLMAGREVQGVWIWSTRHIQTPRNCLGGQTPRQLVPKGS